jgi:tetratricopeptide (TPR) repeat protein
LDSLEVVADACLDLCMVFWFSGDFKKGQEYANRALRTALDNDYLEIAVLAYDRVGGFLPSEEYEKRLECFEKGLSLAKKVGDISRQSWFLQNLAYEYRNRGELNKAVSLEDEALAINKRVGSTAYIPFVLVDLGVIYQTLGEWDKSKQCYDEATVMSGKTTDFLPKASSHVFYGLLHFDKEDYIEARKSLEEAIERVKKAGFRTQQMFISQYLLMTSIELDEIGKAIELLDSLHNFALETKDKGWNAVVMALEAMLLRGQKKYDESIEVFEKTLQEWKAIKADIWLAYDFARWVLCEYARAYLERNHEGDREKAHNLLNQALEMFQKMGAKKDIEKVLAKKRLLTA